MIICCQCPHIHLRIAYRNQLGLVDTPFWRLLGDKFLDIQHASFQHIYLLGTSFQPTLNLSASTSTMAAFAAQNTRSVAGAQRRARPAFASNSRTRHVVRASVTIPQEVLVTAIAAFIVTS